MKETLLKIWPYLSIPVIITIGTIIYQSGSKEATLKITDEIILNEVLKTNTQMTEGFIKFNGSITDLTLTLDSLTRRVEKMQLQQQDRFDLIQQEIEHLMELDQSGEAVKAIEDWRKWYESRYNSQQERKKKLTTTPYALGL